MNVLYWTAGKVSSVSFRQSSVGAVVCETVTILMFFSLEKYIKIDEFHDLEHC